MAEFDIELPPGWSERSKEDQHGAAVAEYQHTTEEDTRFIVSLVPRSPTADAYKLRLSTVTVTSPYIRHDYLVNEYDTRTAAFEGADAFIEHISAQLYDGSVSHDDPEIEAIRGAIQDFTGGHLLSSIRQLVYRLYR